MGLFTALVFNNGTAHTMIFQGQLPDPKYMIGKYIEPAAVADAQSQVLIKHDEAQLTRVRSLLQRRVMVAGTDGVLYPITINLSAQYNKKHTIVNVTDQTKFVSACMADVTFHNNFAMRLI